MSVIKSRKLWEPFGTERKQWKNCFKNVVSPAFPAHMQRRNSPSEIRIDSKRSDYAIIVDIRVPDRVGLLYTISNVFYELGLGIRLAKITTRAFTAIDSFYVTEEDGAKTTSPDRIAAVKRALATALGHSDIIDTSA